MTPADVDRLMEELPEPCRRWCYVLCACSGCAIGTGITRDEFIAWLERHGKGTRAEEDADREMCEAEYGNPR